MKPMPGRSSSKRIYSVDEFEMRLFTIISKVKVNTVEKIHKVFFNGQFVENFPGTHDGRKQGILFIKEKLDT